MRETDHMQPRTQRLAAQLHTHLADAIRQRPLVKVPARSSAVFLVVIFLLAGAFITTRFLDSSAVVVEGPAQKPISSGKSTATSPNKAHYPLDCTTLNRTRSCPNNYPSSSSSAASDPNGPPPATCPDYFRWIHEDLRPWAHTGITRETLERAKRTANFRLVIVNGRAYVELFQRAFQTRDVFTLWGILQLLRRYPGKVPDLELMFDCVDWPVVRSVEFAGAGKPDPPPLFRYCGDDETMDIVFPDWSFWGWAEINIKPWDQLLKDLKEGNERTRWIDREPYAYWKGNPAVAATRQDLMKCNVSDKEDWNARVYAQDWGQESQQGYKNSDLASQCIHRYKIYIEGSAWSVSEKYILACDSLALLVKPHYYDFFTRGLQPIKHYWPIKEDDKCRSIKYAVNWGNSHKRKAQEIGKAASKFIQDELKMDIVYDYMFHLLSAYAKLLTFKPVIPPKAVEYCTETMACKAEGPVKEFMTESMVMSPAEASACTMPPPYDPPSLHASLARKDTLVKQVESWEQKYYGSQI